MIQPEPNTLKRDRLLAIGPRREMCDYLRQRYPDVQVTSAKSLLEGIDKLATSETRAVIAYVDPSEPQLADAVSGLREAAGQEAKVLLCCKPECEPQVRRAIDAGANDYLLYPLEGPELDEALGYVRVGELELPAEGEPVASMDELRLLADLLAHLDEDGFAVLTKLADLIRLALDAEATTIVVEGTAASSGSSVADPVLVERVRQDDRTIGQITVGRRPRPYDSGDVDKLRHYARLASHLLAAAATQRRWRTQALTDQVSGLRNRRYMLTFLDDLLVRARAERFRVTVLLFDIDDFKSYNDRYGHAAGDEIIRCIGELFKAHCREHDLVTRYGGDEFVVVFWDADRPRVTGSDHPPEALAVLRRFREALRNYRCNSTGAEVRGELTISGGLAGFPWDASTTADLLERADEALLQAKLAGKNQIFVFDADQPHEAPTSDD